MDVYGSSGKHASYPSYPDQINSINGVNANGHSRNSQFGGNDSLVYPDEENPTPSAYVDFSMAFDNLPGQEGWGGTIKPSSRSSHGRRISGNIADRVARYEDLAATQSSSRPITPPNQDSPSTQIGKPLYSSTDRNVDYFPLTPAQTPYTRPAKIAPTPQTFSGEYDTSMEATIKPTPRRNRQSLSNFQEMRNQSEMNDSPSPPSSSPMPNSTFMSMQHIKTDSRSYESPYQSPSHSKYSPQNFQSQSSSPELSQRSLYRDPFDNKPHLDAPNKQYPELGEFESQANTPNRSSSMHRSLSVDSMNIDEAHTETGITVDDIACYISGPDPIDQKWLCLFPSCNKRFGRKENIKSHVQTHLGDRQFQCPHCRKCFVRQHDLKRHAKIHSGVKPYPCACGNSFARHDALTRHRQRGMCVGAFEGVVKKVVKRGRPRKHRPEHDERLDKSQRTRSKNSKKAASASNASSEAPSSASEYSESSYGLSPPADYDVLNAPPFADYAASPYTQADPFIGSANSNADLDYALQQPVASAQEACISPQAIQNAPSPAYSQHSHTQSHHSHHSAAPSPTLSVHSIHSPPDLCASFEPSSPSASLSFYDMPSQDADEMFLEAFGNESLSMGRLEQETDLLSLIGGKEFEAFQGDDVDELFGDGEAAGWVN
jgi:regulatory protein SWI5